ncbi:MAG: ribbon-helix-helix protein, CopG family [Actinomycetota bacterium]|nr:ribbon-helix-helix protein, CopG family [Nitrospiraceae bacterium]MDA8157150.1 ribbon-helix-helix protein, CopG family [Actinomycetota bacterium]
MAKVISTKVEEETDKALEAMAAELSVTKSWIVNQALRQYIGRYEAQLSDMRIASIGETIAHEDVMQEYELRVKKAHAL